MVRAYLWLDCSDGSTEQFRVGSLKVRFRTGKVQETSRAKRSAETVKWEKQINLVSILKKWVLKKTELVVGGALSWTALVQREEFHVPASMRLPRLLGALCNNLDWTSWRLMLFWGPSPPTNRWIWATLSPLDSSNFRIWMTAVSLVVRGVAVQSWQPRPLQKISDYIVKPTPDKTFCFFKVIFCDFSHLQPHIFLRT